MKHIIIIETVDVEAGGEPVSYQFEVALLRGIGAEIEKRHGACNILSCFNQESAVAAIHGLYNVQETKTIQ
jgi:hypothetical protein